MKFSYISILILLTQIPAASGQDSSFKEDYLPIWKSAWKITINLAEAMPEHLYSYKPTTEMKSFAEQLIHIGHSTLWMHDYLILGNTDDLVVAPEAANMSKTEVIAYINQSFDQGYNNIRNHDPEDLNRNIDFFGEGEIKVKWVFIFIQDHLVNHRAKANLYLRLNGLEPPAYGYLTKE